VEKISRLSIVRIFQDGYQDRSVNADTNLVIAVRGGL